jgi:hypothetical protein
VFLIQNLKKNWFSLHIHYISEQLKKVETDINSVSHNLETSEYLINGMKSWWGGLMQYFTTDPETCTSGTRLHSPKINTTACHGLASKVSVLKLFNPIKN